MAKSGGLYQLLGASDTQDLSNKLNLLLAHISDRLDKIEGLRGTSTIASDLALAGDANVTGDANITGDAAITGDQSVTGNQSVTGTSSLTGAVTASSTADIAGTTLIAGHMRVNTVADADDVVTETVTWEGNASTSGSIDVGGDVTVSQDLLVYNASVSGDTEANGPLTARNTSDLQGNTLVAGHMRVITVDDAGELVTETVSWEGNAIGSGNLEVGGDMTVGQDLTVGGAIDADNVFKVGMILMWSGSVASIPPRWALCDGSGTTPDLRDRFVVGAGSTFSVDDTGGTADPTTLTTSAPSATETVDNNLDSSTVAVGSGVHTHDLDVSLANKYTLTPYYALAYIIYTG